MERSRTGKSAIPELRRASVRNGSKADARISSLKMIISLAVSERWKRSAPDGKNPVIFVTGYAEELQDRVPNATVIQKPVEEGELAAAVRKVLDMRCPPA